MSDDLGLFTDDAGEPPPRSRREARRELERVRRRKRRGSVTALAGVFVLLLVGAALTQRPELYRAVVCSAPLLDMVRYERFLLGRTWNDEYGTAEDPQELEWLLSYSPYHHVAEGTAYPSVLFTVYESDMTDRKSVV